MVATDVPPWPRGFPRRFPVHPDVGRSRRYSTVAAAGRLFARVFLGHRFRIEGIEGVPARGPLLICSNHLSNLDPLLMGSFTPGNNAAMAKKELFRNPLLAWVWGGCNVYPIDRGAADRRALKVGLDVLDRGGRLMVWVEGTRADSPGMRRAEPGVGFLLRQRPDVPVLPVGVIGTEASLVRGHLLPRRVPITVRFGTPQRVDLAALPAHDNQVVADAVGRMIAGLLPEAYRGHYGSAGGGP